MAVTITTHTDKTPAVTLLGGVQFVAQKLIDFSAVNSASGDTVQCINIPADTLVTAVTCEIITAEGGTLTATLGDGTDPNGWYATVDLNAAAGTTVRTLAGTDAYATGKRYTAADTIDFVMSANAGDTAKVLVIVEGTKIEAV